MKSLVIIQIYKRFQVSLYRTPGPLVSIKIKDLSNFKQQPVMLQAVFTQWVQPSMVLVAIFFVFLAHLSRRLIGELIVYQWSGVRPSFTMLKHLLLRNRLANQSQILCGASLGRRNEILVAACGSHDQDGRHAHIW